MCCFVFLYVLINDIVYVLIQGGERLMLEFEGVKYFTVAETAERLNLSEQTIRRWIREGRLKAAKLGRSYMVSIDSIRSLIMKEE